MRDCAAAGWTGAYGFLVKDGPAEELAAAAIRKLGARSRLEALNIAEQKGWL